MSCTLSRQRLQLFLEGRLSDDASREVEQHVQSCETCQAVEIVEPELRDLLCEKLGRAAPGAALRARVRAIAAGAEDPPQAAVVDIRSRWYRRALASPWTPRVAMVATLLFLILVPFHLLQQAPALAKAAARRHDCHAPTFGQAMPPCCHDLLLAVGDALDAPSKGTAVPDLAGSGLQLVTVTRCSFDNVVVNQIGYRDANSRSFSLYMSDQVTEQFMLLDTQSEDGAPRERHRLEENDVTIWERDGLIYFWVGPHASSNYDTALAMLMDTR